MAFQALENLVAETKTPFKTKKCGIVFIRTNILKMYHQCKHVLERSAERKGYFVDGLVEHKWKLLHQQFDFVRMWLLQDFKRDAQLSVCRVELFKNLNDLRTN